MKLPNGYGSVVKLSRSRRKPWAVRISYLEEQPNGIVKRKRKYLNYFKEQKSALAYLAEYNAGAVVSEHQRYTDTPTFAELFGKWEKYKRSLKNPLSASTWRNYHIAFGMFSPVHHEKIVSLRAQQLQDCILAQNSKSRSTSGNMRAILRGMWEYAIMNEYTEKNITEHLVFDFTDSGIPIHTRFSDHEIAMLWDALYTINNTDIVLIYIYTGCRPVELLDIESKNVYLEDRYMIGGVKTAAGKNHVIPLHEAIVPLVEKRLSEGRQYLITNKYGNHYTRAVYSNSNWNTLMGRMNLNHSPHDYRYTFAALADACGMNETCKKIIMGHALPNRDGLPLRSAAPGM